VRGIKVNDSLMTKYDRLRTTIRKAGPCAVAYSGGVDSTLVLRVAKDVHGNRLLAVIATSSTYARREFEEAVRWVRMHGIEYLVIHSEELDIPGFRNNSVNRCYFCKRELFTKIKQIAAARGIHAVLDGTNADDLQDFRPGLKAAEEIGIVSPLRDAGLTKAEIREISRDKYRLSTADKPAMACLASRFPYGSSITREKLKQIETIEDHLMSSGFRNFRARHHGSVVRIELSLRDLHRMLDESIRRDTVRCAKNQGFSYVTLDLEGYRTGSMNEELPDHFPPESKRGEAP
jgi:uncharacterized protein